ncbi:low temperature requirement protein A [Micromonospora sp. NPDC049559]|uniref:low temperature requirement protein A n=1 Tax=Micromonospora sp. NPDC049559 TaxID=3155923 RepID=UPI00342047D8
MTWLPRVAGLLRLRAPGPAGQQEGERHATWLELFFDLVFALALEAVTARLGGPSPTLARAAVAIALFLVVQWAWATQTFYDTRFDPDDWPHRILVFTATAGAGGIAIGAHHPPGGMLLPAGYLVVRGALLLMYLRVLVTSRSERSLTTVYLAGFSVGWCLWLVSLAAPVPARPILWAVALVIELSTPLWGHRWLERHPVDPTHLPERIGQFTIILLGVTLTNLIDALTAAHPPAAVVGAALVAFVIPICIWWVYTTFLTTRLAVPRLDTGVSYAFLHAPLGIGILFLGWALGQVLLQVAEEKDRLPGPLRVGFAASLVIFTLAGLSLQWFSLGRVPRVRLGIAAVGIVPVVLTTAMTADPMTTLAVAAGSMVAYALFLAPQLRHVGARVGSL